MQLLRSWRRRFAALAILAAVFWGSGAAAASDSGATPLAASAGAPRTGILYDRVLPLSHLESYDGSAAAPAASRACWSQIVFELTQASIAKPAWPSHQAVLETARGAIARGVVPVAILDFEYERSTNPDGSPSATPTPAVHEAFAAAALAESTHRGAGVTFAFESEWYVTNRSAKPRTLAVDFGDGLGWRTVRWGDRPQVHYDRTGHKVIRLRITDTAGRTLQSTLPFEVLHLETPAPNDTLHIVAGIPYLGTAGQGDAYVYLAPGHAALTNPIVVLEGFDLDNSMFWDELYQMLNEQGLIESLRSQGFDAVVLNFADATDYIQRNAFVASELITQVEAAIAPNADMALVGASMGGLVGRYALAYLEAHGPAPRVRTFVSFDSPQRGANIPLGVQYWVQFFADQSTDAAFLRDRLNTPAARQMLVYHFTTPPSGTAASDPLRTQLLADFAVVGGYPGHPRLVAIANGSGSRAGQGFAPAEQVVRYEYSSFLVHITGNVWAVPNGGSATVFRGIIDYLFPPPESSTTVTVTGTAPYDNAPGGWRSSMADMDATPAPFGDIVALYPNHCFIPTTSALDLNTTDLFYDIAGDAQLLTRTPFQAVYFPAVNQGHVSITPENATWLLQELVPAPTAVADGTGRAPAALVLHPNVPNPFNPSTQIEFELPHAGNVEIAVRDVRGRHVATLLHGWLAAGRHDVRWNGTTESGTHAASGVYVCTLASPDGRVSRRMVLIE